jgi:uncharacterized protein YecT (DUF1311 family)
VRIALAVATLLVAGLKPPVIHDGFTPLPCPKNPVSTLDIEGCLENQISAVDHKINVKARAIFFQLAPRERPGFVRGEREWLAYRQDNCAAEASKYAGGTAAPLLDASCQLARGKTHLADLTELLKTLLVH